MIPLSLTSQRQSALAEMARLASATKTQLDTPLGKVDFDKIGEEFCLILDRYYNLSPQDWGDIYDKLHRTGANS